VDPNSPLPLRKMVNPSFLCALSLKFSTPLQPNTRTFSPVPFLPWSRQRSSAQRFRPVHKSFLPSPAQRRLAGLSHCNPFYASKLKLFLLSAPLRPLPLFPPSFFSSSLLVSRLVFFLLTLVFARELLNASNVSCFLLVGWTSDWDLSITFSFLLAFMVLLRFP